MLRGNASDNQVDASENQYNVSRHQGHGSENNSTGRNNQLQVTLTLGNVTESWCHVPENLGNVSFPRFVQTLHRCAGTMPSRHRGNGSTHGSRPCTPSWAVK